MLEPLFGWLRSIGAGNWASVLVPLVVVAVAIPVFVVATLLVAALLMTPAIVRLVAARRFPQLEARRRWQLLERASPIVAGLHRGRRRRAGAEHSRSGSCRRSCLVLPPLIWGWLTYRVFGYDVLATHASRDERVRLLRRRALAHCSASESPAARWARRRRCCGA